MAQWHLLFNCEVWSLKILTHTTSYASSVHCNPNSELGGDQNITGACWLSAYSRKRESEIPKGIGKFSSIEEDT